MKILNVRSLGVIASAVLMVAAFGGCNNNGPAAISPGFTASETGGGSSNETTTREELPEYQDGWLFAPDTGLQVVYFDYNSYALRDDALQILRANADKIKGEPNTVIQIEGHCDERGTQEYNLALGEKRALATREHLMNLGISGDRMITISYGEEDPKALGHDESSWSQNRRSQFNRAM